MNILRHILFSQLLIFMIVYISTNIDLFSNQIYSLQLEDNQAIQNYSKTISNFIEQENIHQNMTQVKKMSKIQRFILSHIQFDGLHFFTNEYKYQSNFAFTKGYTTLIGFAKLFIKNIYKSLAYHIIQFFSQQISNKPYLAQILLLILINKVFFAFSCYKIYQIILKLSQKDKNKAQIITLLFIYNPSCVFFNAIYSQSIYSYITYSSILMILKFHKSQISHFQKKTQKINSLQKQYEQQKNNLKVKKKTSNSINTNKFHFQKQLIYRLIKYGISIILLSFGVFFRTNGIFLSIIIGLPIIFQLWCKIIHFKILSSIITLLKGIFVLMIILVPLIWYYYFTYQNLCLLNQINVIYDENLRESCFNYKLFPNLYNFVQQKYWSVGFLKYFKPQNAIFILLGTPTLILSFGVFSNVKEQIIILINYYNQQKTSQVDLSFSKAKFQSVKVGIYISFCVLYLVTIFLTNIQSSTRFFSTHPVFYLLLSQKIKSIWTKVWIVFYVIFGSILFYIGFPWT